MTKNIVITEKVLQQNPLFWSGQGPVAIKPNKPNVFTGTGICNPTQLSQAIPFDALGFLLSAEFIKRQIPSSHVLLLTKALKIAQLQFKVFTQVINSLKLKNWHIFLVSKLFPQALPASYEALETRDVNHFPPTDLS